MKELGRVQALVGLLSLFSAWLAFPQIAFGQKLTYQISSDTTSYIIGSPIFISQTWTSSADQPLDIPSLPDTLYGLEKLGEQAVEQQESEGMITRIRKHTYICFDSAYIIVPSQQFSFSSGMDSTVLKTHQLFIDIQHAKLDTTDEIRPIEPPAEIPYKWEEFKNYVIGGAIAVAALAILIGIFIRRKSKSSEEEKPKRPAYVVAFEKLEEIKAKKLWQKGELKAYHSGISEIVREYVEGRYQLPALESTTDDLEESLKQAQIEDRLRKELIKMLRLTDYVKFAKGDALPNENEYIWDLAHRLVKDTMIVAEEKANSENNAG